MSSISNWVSKVNLRYQSKDESVANCLCAFCCVENGKDKQAETTIGTHISFVAKEETIRFRYYEIPCCKNCYNYYDDQERYLNGIEKAWVYNLYEELHVALTKHGFNKSK